MNTLCVLCFISYEFKISIQSRTYRKYVVISSGMVDLRIIHCIYGIMSTYD